MLLNNLNLNVESNPQIFLENNLIQIAQEKFNRVVVWKDRGVQDLALSHVAGFSKTVQRNDPLIKVAQGLGIYIGELN